jgi:endonuclease/exonuclease/phosphatase family metal-dependent hydrolase
MQNNSSLKILSWNVNYENTRIEEVCVFVRKMLIEESYDLLCMQEVSEQLFKRLSNNTDFFIEKGLDAALQFPDGAHPIYHVIISKIKASSSKELAAILIPNIHTGNPFSPFLRFKNIWINPALKRGFLSADFSFNTNSTAHSLRIFSIHPPLSSPQDRIDDLALVFKELSKDSPNIVCGDFNILETYPVKLLNWMLRGHFKQALPSFPERSQMELLFKIVGLKNPHAGMHLKTQREARSQLDHILVPITATVIDQTALTGTRAGFIGSDHYPVVATVTL